MMQEYITREFEVLEQPNSKELKSYLKWTGSKASLVELIYAIHYSGCVSNGTSHVSDLVKLFEKVFNTNLVYCYNIYTEISSRKKERTPLLDSMKARLIQKMDEI